MVFGNASRSAPFWLGVAIGLLGAGCTGGNTTMDTGNPTDATADDTSLDSATESGTTDVHRDRQIGGEVGTDSAWQNCLVQTIPACGPPGTFMIQGSGYYPGANWPLTVTNMTSGMVVLQTMVMSDSTGHVSSSVNITANGMYDVSLGSFAGDPGVTPCQFDYTVLVPCM